tara:strand:+ start:558 stop:905 length:348 start_codon:yes stop_codon:yes gene_type:complete
LRRKNKMGLIKKRKYEATLLYLNAHHIELFNRIDSMLSDNESRLEDMRVVIEEWAQVESAFNIFKSRFGPMVQPAPPTPTAAPKPATSLTEKDLAERSPTFRKSVAGTVNTKEDK